LIFVNGMAAIAERGVGAAWARGGLRRSIRTAPGSEAANPLPMITVAVLPRTIEARLVAGIDRTQWLHNCVKRVV
jgi:hypothetical protein